MREAITPILSMLSWRCAHLLPYALTEEKLAGRNSEISFTSNVYIRILCKQS